MPDRSAAVSKIKSRMADSVLAAFAGHAVNALATSGGGAGLVAFDAKISLRSYAGSHAPCVRGLAGSGSKGARSVFRAISALAMRAPRIKRNYDLRTILGRGNLT